jgi:hypothetical protein
MGGDYPSADFAISEEGEFRRVIHLPTGMVIEARRVRRDPVAVSREFRLEVEDRPTSYHPQGVAQAALRHLRVWLLRRYGPGARQ